MAKNLVLWDWDGTIVDNHGAARLALQDMADKYGLEKITDDDLQNVMGAYRGAFWTFHFGSKADEPYQYFIQRFEENNKKNAPVIYQRVTQALDYLKANQVPQIVLSNMPQAMLDEQSERTGLREYFVRLVGLGKGQKDRKPHVEHVQQAVRGIDYDKLIMIGDGESDLMTAKNADAQMVYIAQKPRTDFKYDFLAKTHAQIMEFLKPLIEGK